MQARQLTAWSLHEACIHKYQVGCCATSKLANTGGRDTPVLASPTRGSPAALATGRTSIIKAYFVHPFQSFTFLDTSRYRSTLRRVRQTHPPHPPRRVNSPVMLLPSLASLARFLSHRHVAHLGMIHSSSGILVDMLVRRYLRNNTAKLTYPSINGQDGPRDPSSFLAAQE